MDWLNQLLAPFAAYPRWFVLSCLVVVAVAVGWLLVKVLKWTLYLVLLGALVGLVVVVLAWLLG
jgi:hypothetical protein